MLLLVILAAVLVAQDAFALNPNYRECTDDDCYYYDHQKDPRNQVLDLYENIEDQMAETVQMPDFEIYASFHSGNLTYDYEDSGDYLCVCPLNKKIDELYAVFHDQLLLYIQYKWTIPWSPYTNYTINGDMFIGAEVFYNLYFINHTNGGGPSIDRINITNFNLYNWYFDGQPLEMLEKFPDEMMKKTMVAVLKQPLEEKITLTYNNAIQNSKENILRSNAPRRRFYSNSKINPGIKLLNLLKSSRKMKIKKSKYFFRDQYRA